MNTNKLRGIMAERRMTQRQLAKAIKISNNSMSRKLTGKRAFTIAEATAICRVLEISDPASLFFSDHDSAPDYGDEEQWTEEQ